MAKRISSPLTVFRFSCWHFSEAARNINGRGHRVVSSNQLTLAGNEGDELADTFLHAFLCFLGYLCIVGESHLHDAGDWSEITNVSIRGSSGIGRLGSRLGRQQRRRARRGSRHGASCRAAVLQVRGQGDSTQRRGRGAVISCADGSNPSTCRRSRLRGGQIRRQGEKGRGRRTIGDWKPSVLLLDFEFVPESLRLCFLSLSVHMRLRIVRRLSCWFHAVLLGRGGRHVYSAGCRA